MRRLAPLLAALTVGAGFGAVVASADAARPPAAGVAPVLKEIVDQFAAADPTHDAAAAERARTLAAVIAARVGSVSRLRSALGPARRLVRTLSATRVRLQPWPLPQTIRAQSGAVAATVADPGAGSQSPADGYQAIDQLLADAADASGARGLGLARVDAAAAYSVFALGPSRRIGAANAALAAETSTALWSVLGAVAHPAVLDAARGRAESDLDAVANVLGDVDVSRATVVADAGVIVFREGLEAVLILAAITASFTGSRRRLRRPVLVGGLVGLLATALTYLLAQTLLAALGDSGLRLQAITGVIAIAVLLVVTNWFFHRVYWSEWIGRLHRRRRTLERIDRLGFLSGQTVAFLLLGLTSVYREGFETVLFLQNLQLSAGTGATILGVCFGLAATLVVGAATFALERKLPYRRMLIATGILIGLVLAIMVGTTVHNLQGLGWVPTTPTFFDLDLAWGRWLGLFANWEGIGAQVAGLLVVYGSYALARAIQSRRRRAAVKRTSSADAWQAS